MKTKTQMGIEETHSKSIDMNGKMTFFRDSTNRSLKKLKARKNPIQESIENKNPNGYSGNALKINQNQSKDYIFQQIHHISVSKY